MILACIQARMGSTRLSAKVLKPLAGIPVIEHVIARVRRARRIDDVIVVTSIQRENVPLIHTVTGMDTQVFVGSEDDVLDRFWQAVRLTKAEHIVRITADCPVMDPEVIDGVIAFHLEGGYDYTSNVDPPSWPDGLDVEVFTRSALEEAWTQAEDKKDREHVTPFIRNNTDRFRTGNLTSEVDLSHHRWTLDREEDYQFLQTVFLKLYETMPTFGHRDILALLENEPDLTHINSAIGRNEGY